MNNNFVSPSSATENGSQGRDELVVSNDWVVVNNAEGALVSSVQESGDECTSVEVGMGVDGHVPANRELTRSESTGSESSVASELSEMQGKPW